MDEHDPVAEGLTHGRIQHDQEADRKRSVAGIVLIGLDSELRNPDGECGMPDHSARLLRVSAAGILLGRCSKQAVLHHQDDKSDCDYRQH